MAAIALEEIEHRYGGSDRQTAHGSHAVRGVSLQIADGELMVLVGPSGCGKSTLLRIIAGLETPTAGRVVIGGRDVTAAAPQDRDVAMVFQSYALYPHMTVRQNLAYGLRVRGVDRGAIEPRVAAAAEALGLQPLLDRRPAQLSGGQRQRVALGRAMVREPQAFLLDEPLSNLDPALRTQARAELLQLHRRLRATIVYVTHDQEEAMTLGSRVAVMREGAIEQVGPPMDLYSAPANTFVAGFIGLPPMNLVTAPLPGMDAGPGSVVGIRPHDVVLSAAGHRGTVDVVERRGHDALVHLRMHVDAREIPLIAVVTSPPPAPGSIVGVMLPPERLHIFDRQGRRRS